MNPKRSLISVVPDPSSSGWCFCLNIFCACCRGAPSPSPPGRRRGPGAAAVNQRGVMAVWAPSPTTRRVLIGARLRWGLSRHLPGRFVLRGGRVPAAEALGFPAGKGLGSAPRWGRERDALRGCGTRVTDAFAAGARVLGPRALVSWVCDLWLELRPRHSRAWQTSTRD